jgi:hypothetical protein
METNNIKGDYMQANNMRVDKQAGKVSYTPGPWKIVDDYGRYEIETDRHSIASVHDYPGYDTGNAALIATAPELLEELKMIVRKSPACLYEELIDLDRYSMTLTGRELRQIINLIAKAEGRE